MATAGSRGKQGREGRIKKVIQVYRPWQGPIHGVLLERRPPFFPVSPAEPAGWGVGKARWDLSLNVEPWDSPKGLPHGCLLGQMLVNTPSFFRAGVGAKGWMSGEGDWDAWLPSFLSFAWWWWGGGSWVLMKYGVPGKGRVFGSNTGICLFLALRPWQII